jgi:hypothetical protein
MNRPTPLSTAALPVPNSISRSPLRRGLLFIVLALCCFAFSPAQKAFGVTPAPDGGYPNGNTAEGQNALFSLTSGINNTAVGFDALNHNTTGTYNTADGYEALLSNTTGRSNTAEGVYALYHNTTGSSNTANGFEALLHNTTGYNNTANGAFALFSNTTGGDNTANGVNVLYHNTTGIFNTANGINALYSNTTGSFNTANGDEALYANTTGSSNTATGYQAHYGGIGDGNTANGYQALYGNNGTGNIAVGLYAGSFNQTGSYNIDIGNIGSNESNTIRIGESNVQTATFIAGIYGATASGGVAVYVNSDGQLGTLTSSARFKQNIQSMDKASDVLLALRPVTFRYKPEIDPQSLPQFGLVAEEVEKVNPALVVRDADGKVFTVRYEAVNAMLLNEFLKEHRKVEQLEATAAHQQEQIEALTAGLQRVSAQVEMSRPARQMVLNDQ